MSDQAALTRPAAPTGEVHKQSRSAETRAKIIQAAEKLFARRSFASVSMREITGEAGVALAAAHYHFGSKEDLFRAVFLRRARDLNRERFELLRQAADSAGPGVVPLRTVLNALLRPGVRWSFDEGGGGCSSSFWSAAISIRIHPSTTRCTTTRRI